MKYTYEDFISKAIEVKEHKKSLYYDYSFPYNEIIQYVNEVLQISVSDMVGTIRTSNEIIELEAKDIVQFSNIDDATVRLCKLIKNEDNPGVKYVDAGKLLLNDGIERNEVAYRKYGENHLKTSEILGYTFEFAYTYFLSPLGMIVEELSKEEFERLNVRLILRGKLVRRLIRASTNGRVCVREMVHMLSDSTYHRRSSNIKTLFKILSNSDEYNFNNIIQMLDWSCEKK